MITKQLLKKLSSIMVATVLFSAVSTPMSAKAVESNEEDKVIKVFHTNDTHSRVGNFPKDKAGEYYFAKAKAYVDSESQKANGRLLIDAGDTYHGQTFATLERGSSIARLLKAMGYDAMAPGNHDFNYGQDRLQELVNEAGVPVLAANVIKDGKPAFKDYIVKDVAGAKVGIFGLATPETAYKTNPLNVKGLDFGNKESIIDKSQEIVNKLREIEKVDVVIAVGHLGIDINSEVKSTDVAANVEGIDLFIDGHSHSTLDKYAEFNKKHKTQIVGTGEYFTNIGDVTITLDKDNKVKNIEAKSEKIAELKAEDAGIKALIDEVMKGQEHILNEQVASTPIKLDGERNQVRFGHTNLGRLITSAMLAETGAEIAITNGGGIRTSIDEGDITKGEVISVLPFGNYIVTKKVKGSDIIAALEHGMEVGQGSFSHFAGINVTTALYKDGEKTKHKVISVTINGEPIDLNREYVLATNDFMAVGGDGYTMFGPYKTLNEYRSLDEALITYISKVKAEGIVAIDKEQRLTITEAEMLNKENVKAMLEELIKNGAVLSFEMCNDKLFLMAKGEDLAKAYVVDGMVQKDVENVIAEIKSSNAESDKEELPQTGGVSSEIVIFLGTILVLCGAVTIRKNQKSA